MLLQDIRYAVRSLWNSKGFATVAILCLGFGIGLNATIFSVIDGVLLKPYPYTDPDRILVVGEQNQRTDSQSGLSYLDMRDWKEANSVFTTIAAVAGRSLTISDRGGEPERYLGAGISWDLFPLLGTSPILGRGFTAEDDRPGAGPVVLLGYDLWTRRYRGDSQIVGESILDQRQAARRGRCDAGRLCLSQQSTALDSARRPSSLRIRAARAGCSRLAG